MNKPCTQDPVSVRPQALRRRGRQDGSILVPVAVLLIAIATIGGSALVLLSTDLETQQSSTAGNRAFYLAESGARYAIKRLVTEGETAATDMNGKQYMLADGSGFELAIESEDLGNVIRYYIDSTGFLGAASGADRQSLNGYVVEIIKQQSITTSPVPFPHAIQTLGQTRITIAGSSYIDSYDSTYPPRSWSTPGEFQNGHVSTNLSADAVQLGGNTYIYGNLVAGPNANVDNPSTIVNAPARVTGEILSGPIATATPVPAPPEPPEKPPPTSYEPAPTIPSGGTITFDGGDYSTSGDFNTSWRHVSFTSDTFLLTGRDLKVGSGSLVVDGDFGALTGGDLTVQGGPTGLTIAGDADITTDGKFELSNSGNFHVAGDLDLDVGDDFVMSGNTAMSVGGSADIDVAGKFEMQNSSSITVHDQTIIRVGDSFKTTGSGHIKLGESGFVKMFVEDGDIEIKARDIAPQDWYEPVRFQVFASANVDSVKITAGGTFIGTIYAPEATVVIEGGVQFFGAIVAKELKIDGNVGVHFDESLMRDPIIIDPDTLLNIRSYWIAAGSE